MAITREPRRRRDPALVRYISLIARQIKEANRPRANKDIAQDLGLSGPQFTQALHGQTSSLDVANALARSQGIGLDEFRGRAAAWYADRGVEEIVELVRGRIEPEDLPVVMRRLEEIYRRKPGVDDDQDRQVS